MILLADAGSTKIDWAVVDSRKHEVVDRFRTPGINPVMLSEEELHERFINELRPQLADLTREVSLVEYYGAGCLSEPAKRVAQALQEVTQCRNVKVDSDLEGAARALCGCHKGVVAILGTGSNSALYDGHKITEHTSSLGYILGDEGSGAALGKRLVRDVYKHILPDRICKDFQRFVGMDENAIITRIYREPGANGFLASLAPFLKEHISEPEIESLVEREFEKFIAVNLSRYTGFPKLRVSITGSIGVSFFNILERALHNHGVEDIVLVPNPIEGLIKQYTSQES